MLEKLGVCVPSVVAHCVGTSAIHAPQKCPPQSSRGLAVPVKVFLAPPTKPKSSRTGHQISSRSKHSGQQRTRDQRALRELFPRQRLLCPLWLAGNTLQTTLCAHSSINLEQETATSPNGVSTFGVSNDSDDPFEQDQVLVWDQFHARSACTHSGPCLPCGTKHHPSLLVGGGVLGFWWAPCWAVRSTTTSRTRSESLLPPLAGVASSEPAGFEQVESESQPRVSGLRLLNVFQVVGLWLKMHQPEPLSSTYA